MGEKFVKLTFVLSICVWLCVAAFGFLMQLLKFKKEPRCPYQTLDGDSKSIRAVNYK